jgi:hypothetical protein
MLLIFSESNMLLLYIMYTPKMSCDQNEHVADISGYSN